MKAWLLTSIGMLVSCQADLSDLVCAGPVTPEGYPLLVPSTSVNGCLGATVSGTVTCPDCEFGSDATLELGAMDSAGYVTVCASVPLKGHGNFDFGKVAPFDSYSLDFQGTAGNPFPYFAEEFKICNKDMVIEGEIHHHLQD